MSEIVFEINTDPATGLIYFLLVFFFAVGFTVPIIKYLYVFYIGRFVEKAQKRLGEISDRISERMSDAGRKVSEQMKGGGIGVKGT